MVAASAASVRRAEVAATNASGGLELDSHVSYLVRRLISRYPFIIVVLAAAAADTSSETEDKKLTAEEIAKNVHALKGKLKGGAGGKGRGGRSK